MCKLGFEEAEEPEIKLPTFVGSWGKQRNSRRTSTSASLTVLKPLNCVDHNKLWKILKKIAVPNDLTCLLRNLYAGEEAKNWCFWIMVLEKTLQSPLDRKEIKSVSPKPVFCSIQGLNCCYLTCIQVSQETGKVIWYSHLFKSFPQFVMIHTAKALV